MSCRQGSRPSLRTQTYLQCICRAACAVRLSPLRATSVILLGVRGGWWEDGGREEGRRVGVMQGGKRESGLRQGGTGGGSMRNWPCRPAKSLSYMENTSCLQGNRTTSEFLQTKIAPMSGYDLSVLWASSLSACLSHLNSHTKTKIMFKPKKALNNNFIYC